MFYTIAAVFIGGGLGSVCRYLISIGMVRLFDTRFPLATLSVNVFACLLLGMILLWSGKDQLKAAGWVAFAVIGFCGGFSTFSTFSLETLQLIRNGFYFYASLNVVLSVVSCLVILGLLARS